jgi:hypothetical protein
LCALDGASAVEQRLAAQALADGQGFADGSRSSAIVQAGEIAGLVEQAVGQVVRGAQLAQAADSRGEERAVQGSPAPRALRRRIRALALTGAGVPGQARARMPGLPARRVTQQPGREQPLGSKALAR